MNPVQAIEALAGARDPYLIGVRHHSPVLAAAVPALLEAADPDLLLIELPAELEPWLGWLGHPDTVAPVALAVAGRSGERLGFYPFADFSPELAAIRWAHLHDVPVQTLDLPAARVAGDGRAGSTGFAQALLRTAEVEDPEELWDRLVESRSYGADPERIRRAALAFGWAMRVDAHPEISVQDRARETWMRRRLAETAAARPAVVVGSFHAPALLGLLHDDAAELPEPVGEVATALIPYSFELLDSRSGYPAGIRDPQWQQAVLGACADPAAISQAAATVFAGICRELRASGHVAGTPDAAAAYQLASGLAALRGLPAPGRRELVEALQTALGQGELFGRSRAVARAAQHVLVGDRRGRVAKDAPRSGLITEVETLFAELGLPGPDSPQRVELRLDPRGRTDLRRHLALTRTRAAQIAFAEPRETTGTGDVRALTKAWTAQWQPLTAATLELAAPFGVTLEQVAAGRLLARRRLADELTPALQLDLLRQAAEAALPEVTAEFAAALRHDFLPIAGLPELLAAHDLIQEIEAGHIPGLRLPRLDLTPADLVAAAVAGVAGIKGSADPADARALLQLVRMAESGDVGLGRLDWQLRGLASNGAPLPQGAASAALALLGQSADLGERLAGWAMAPDGNALALRLTGALLVAAPLLESSADLLDPLVQQIETCPAPEFLTCLPALREGFEALSTAARQRFLDAMTDRLGAELDLIAAAPPALLAAWAAADLAGAQAVRELTGDTRPEAVAPAGGTGADTVGGGAVLAGGPGADPAVGGADPAGGAGAASAGGMGVDPVGGTGAQLVGGAGERVVEDLVGDGLAGAEGGPEISALDRWRLVLGREREKISGGYGRAARSLEELYGRGHGEGSGAGGGSGEPMPSAREWAVELEELFGGNVRDEVLGRAAHRGRGDVLLQLDPEKATASIELLEQVLSLAGALPEAKLGTLRRLAERLIAELTRELASKMRPALTGLTTPRPTRRAGGPLDLHRTIRANLATARTIDGAITILPEQPVFRTRAKRSADWHLHLAVDVSGSMERSTIYSALVAAVLHGVPALSVRFVTFSTRVIDLTGQVSDPLGLLLEISVGGGTDIGLGLKYVRENLTVPARSIVAVVSDFEEGCSVPRLLGEVRALAESGAHLLGLAALDDTGNPVYNQAVAAQVAAAGMPVAALSPGELASWIGEKIRG
jgi:hypothetical protein